MGISQQDYREWWKGKLGTSALVFYEPSCQADYKQESLAFFPSPSSVVTSPWNRKSIISSRSKVQQTENTFTARYLKL